MKKPEYDYEFKMGESTEWDWLPKNILSVSENETDVKLVLIDETPFRTVHAEKKALRKVESDGGVDSVEEFEQYIDWGFYDE